MSSESFRFLKSVFLDAFFWQWTWRCAGGEIKSLSNQPVGSKVQSKKKILEDMKDIFAYCSWNIPTHSLLDTIGFRFFVGYGTCRKPCFPHVRETSIGHTRRLPEVERWHRDDRRPSRRESLCSRTRRAATPRARTTGLLHLYFTLINNRSQVFQTSTFFAGAFLSWHGQQDSKPSKVLNLSFVWVD